MTDIRLKLDDTNFGQLVETARSLIPTYAPEWTDHNIHDPGITLIELIAWVTEAQIYSLGRTRRDERWAYGSLLGIRPRGPIPASGLIWPFAGSRTSSAFERTALVLKKGTKATAIGLDAPAFAVARDIFITTAQLTRVTTVTADQQEIDWTSSNVREGAPIRPFDEVPDRRTRFVLDFVGPLGVPTSPTSLTLSLGVRIRPLSELTENHTVPSDQPPSVFFAARLIYDDGEYALAVQDFTQGLLRTGVLLLELPATFREIDGKFSVELSVAGGEFSSPPEILTVRANAVPVIQQENIAEEIYLSTGLPDQAFRLKQTGLIFDEASNSVSVNVERSGKLEEWKYCESLQHKEPTNKAFSIDLSSGSLVFGNGVNGAIPPLGATIQVGYSVSSGSVGNLAAGVDWSLTGVYGSFGSNPDPMSGGLDPLSLDDLRREARVQVRDTHPLVTTADLEGAATELMELRVARAHELTPLPKQNVPDGTRTLVVVRARDGLTDDRLEHFESAQWLSEIHRRLADRLPLGERLRVIGPRYKDVAVRATLVAKRGLDPNAVAKRTRTALAREFAIVASRSNDPHWKLGRDIATTEVLGWLGKVDGVHRVLKMELLENGEPVTRAVRIGRVGLPRLRLADDDLIVQRLPLGAVK